MCDYQESPITGHACSLGERCDLWHRTDNVSITCGSYAATLTDGYTVPETKTYDLAYGGKARFTDECIQAVIPHQIPTSTGSESTPVTESVVVCLFNGHTYTVKAEYEEALLGVLSKSEGV